jgi:hypothetical protein
MIRNFLYSFWKFGAKQTISRALWYWISGSKKKSISKKLDETLKSTVAYGRFSHLKLSKSMIWNRFDRGAMLLGLYEFEIVEAIFSKPITQRIFIDVGAADGYFALGALVSGEFDKAYCFELSKKSQRVIRENARLNNISSEMFIFGAADEHSFLRLPKDDLENSVILIDIEGAEFNILNENVLNKLKKSIVIVELHEWLIADGASKLSTFIRSAETLFDISYISEEGRNPNGIKELTLMSDDERWLICSEGRPRVMSWIRLDPKQLQV